MLACAQVQRSKRQDERETKGDKERVTERGSGMQTERDYTLRETYRERQRHRVRTEKKSEIARD